MYNKQIRPRRLRSSKGIRNLVKETSLSPRDLIAPLFIVPGQNIKEPIDSMPGQFRYSVDLLIEKIKTLSSLGIQCVSLFPALTDELKDKNASESTNPQGLIPQAIKEIKTAVPTMLVMVDVAMDPYSSDGHDGYVDESSGEIINDKTLEILFAMALNFAKAGADILGPSDMMDHRVGFLRKHLDEHGFTNILIMSYTAKYASSFYGPFRDALDSAPKSGDKKTYQMDFANAQEALKELALDEKEGADIVMVKPGISYLDIVYRLSQNTKLPIAAYQVSGEYSMIKAASEKGWLDEKSVMMETLTSFKRAGCDIILTYFAEQAARELNK